MHISLLFTAISGLAMSLSRLYTTVSLLQNAIGWITHFKTDS